MHRLQELKKAVQAIEKESERKGIKNVHDIFW